MTKGTDARGTRAGPGRARAGSGRLTSSMIPEGDAGPSISSSPGASLPPPGSFTGRFRTERSSESDLIRFSLSLPGLGRELAMVFVMAFLGALLGLSIPVASGIIVDQVLPAGRSCSGSTIVCLFLVVMIVAAAIFQAIQGLLVLRIEGRVSATLIPAFWDRLLRLPSRFFARFSSGDLALRAMELTEVFKKVSGAVVATVVTGFFSFFNLALLFYYSWKMALCTTFLLAVLLAVTRSCSWGACSVTRARSARSTERSPACCWSCWAGSARSAPAGAERRAFSRWARRYTERLALTIRARRFSSGIHQWLAVYPILTAMVVYIGAVHLDPNLLNTGSFLAFNIAFANLMAAVLAVGYTSIGLLELSHVMNGSGRSWTSSPSSPRRCSSRSG